jgi:hypothetical protein
MRREESVRRIAQAIATFCIGLWALWPAHGWAAEAPFRVEPANEVERIVRPVRQATITTKDSIATLSFSSSGELTRKVTRTRTDTVDDAAETMLYRYDTQGRKMGEYLADSDGEVVPIRLYAYDSEGLLSAEAAYHMCRTFSTVHVYTYNGSGHVIEDVQFESRRLTRREFQYDEKGQLQDISTHRNGQLLSIARYAYDDTGRVARIVSEQPDGAVVSRLYRYDERENVIVLVETHPRDPAQDKTEVTAYEYDVHGNWTRRTIVRAVNPLDEEGHLLEDPVQVIEREIVYGDRSEQ